MDKVENTGGVCGGRRASTEDAKKFRRCLSIVSDKQLLEGQSDRQVVEGIMQDMVEYLSDHWKEEASRLRKRRFQKAVKRLGMVARFGSKNSGGSPKLTPFTGLLRSRSMA